MAGCAGKRGRAVELSANSTTRGYDTEQEEGLFESTTTVSPVSTIESELNVVDLFSIGASKENGEKEVTKPFIHQVRFHGPQGEVVRVWANIDNGAMKEVMSSTMFKKVKHRLGTSSPSDQLLRVANGVVVKSEARWRGRVEVNGISTDVAFEVFDSGGKWDFLFGKTLLEAFKAVHNYETDQITLNGSEGKVVIRNQAHIANRQHHPAKHLNPQTTAPISVITEDTQPNMDDSILSEVNIGLKHDKDLFTRATAPHKPECVAEVLRLVTIGDDLSEGERQKVRQLVSSFADIFALSVGEVTVVKDAVHHLDIPPKATFAL